MVASPIIRTTPELDEACARARAAGVVALDTEFVWTRTYRPRLGLVQVGTPDACWGLDCLQGLKPTSLASLIADTTVTKILHDARQDLEILWHYTGAKPLNVFDTQRAAGFAGLSGKIGLQKLLEEVLGVGLAKTETCTDWTQRPLTDAQVRYALDDVRYLPELRLALLARAEELGTRAWLEEDMATYDAPGLYDDTAPQEAWRRIKPGKMRLEPRHCAVLRAVATVRETCAQEWDLPRNWLGDDQSLVDMAFKGRAGFFKHRLHGGRREAMAARYAAAIKEALVLPPEDCPSDTRQHYIRDVLDAADRAVEWLRSRAEEIHVDAALIANRATVTAFIDNPYDEQNALAAGWRYESVGREMLAKFAV